MNNLDKDIKNFVINFTDGTSETANKGFFVEFVEKDDHSTTVRFNMVGCKGEDLETIVLSCIRMGQELGMFDENVC